MKKGQITIYVIVGILLLLLLGFLLLRNPKPSQPISQSQLEPLKYHVEGCLEKTSQEALYQLGQQGRLYSDYFITSGDQRIAYFYYEGKGLFPSDISILEEDIARFVQTNIVSCIEKDQFKYEVRDYSDKIKVNADFNDQEMVVKMTYPFKVIIGKSDTTISDFQAYVDVSFIPLYKVSRNIYERVKEDPGWVPVEYLYEQQYKIRLLKVTEGTMVYELTDEVSMRDPYIYRFAVKYR